MNFIISAIGWFHLVAFVLGCFNIIDYKLCITTPDEVCESTKETSK